MPRQSSVTPTHTHTHMHERTSSRASALPPPARRTAPLGTAGAAGAAGSTLRITHVTCSVVGASLSARPRLAPVTLRIKRVAEMPIMFASTCAMAPLMVTTRAGQRTRAHATTHRFEGIRVPGGRRALYVEQQRRAVVGGTRWTLIRRRTCANAVDTEACTVWVRAIARARQSGRCARSQMGRALARSNTGVRHNAE